MSTKLCCFCAIVNRIIFFLFGRFGCFLGEAADQKGKISMQQEYALIENYNQAKQELLVALLAISKPSAAPSAKDKWETAQINYKEAATKRATQVQQFGFSKKASDEGLSPTLLQLADARILELIRLFGQDSQIDPSTVTTDTLLFNRNLDASRLRNAYPKLAIEALSPGIEERDQLELQRNALQEQLKKTPNLDTLDSTLQSSTSSPSSPTPLSTSSSTSSKKMLFDCYLEAQDALAKAFATRIKTLKDPLQAVMIPCAIQIEESLISNFATATLDYAAKENSAYLLDLVKNEGLVTGSSALNLLQRRVILAMSDATTLFLALPMLALKVQLAQKWKLDSLEFISAATRRAVSDSEFLKHFLPTAIEKNYAMGSNPFTEFYIGMKSWYCFLYPLEEESRAAGFAKERLKDLFIELTAQNSRFYTNLKSAYENPTPLQDFLCDVGKAMPGFKKGASVKDQDLAHNLVYNTLC